MTFTTVNVDREQLLLLSQLLLTVSPGCTIHQNCDPVRALQRLSTQKVDAVFADADSCSDLLHMLNGTNGSTSVYLMCRPDLQPVQQTEGIRAIVTYPITKQKIRLALQTRPREIREVV